VLVAAIFAMALAVDTIEPLKRLDLYLKAHAQPYVASALAALVAGFALLAYAWCAAFIRWGYPMSEDEAKAIMSWQGQQFGIFRGKAVGREARLAASFRELKDAFRSGAWLREPAWRPLSFGLIGTLFVFIGAFGYLFVVSPPTVKVIASAAMVYALARTGWGFWKA
jgi:hypothetical protein